MKWLKPFSESTFHFNANFIYTAYPEWKSHVYMGSIYSSFLKKVYHIHLKLIQNKTECKL